MPLTHEACELARDNLVFCLPLGSFVCDVLLCFVTFPCGVLGHVWYLIVSISDLCLLTYIYRISKMQQLKQVCTYTFLELQQSK